MNTGLNYSTWKKDHTQIISHFAGKKLLLLFSAGKDSSVALDLLLKATSEFDFELEAHAAAFPVHRYTAAEKDRIGAYWLKQGVDIKWHDVAETDDAIRAASNPCLPCQNVRRKVLNQFLNVSNRDWERLVICISFSLWDIVSYSIEHVLTDIYTSRPPADSNTGGRRFMETALRFYPLVKMTEGYSVFRPLIRYNNDDILTVISRNNIPILSIPCEFKEYRPKRILQRYYEKVGMRFDYHRVLDFAVNSLGLPDPSAYAGMEKEEYLQKYF